MQMILHIGTHKTGTSAVQECLYRNEQKLAARGIYYGHRARSPTLNQLAQLVAVGRKVDAQALVDSHLAKANALGAATLLISAKSFFAMTMFFHKLSGEACEDYWAAKSRCIELLHGLLPADMPKRVVAFFRRQDKFLESVYAQTVRTRPVSASCDQFKASVGEALDYARHMQLWRPIFPDCVVYSYEETANHAARFFLRNVLKIDDTEHFDGLDLRVNTSLARDLVEYKRELNKATSFVDQRMSDFVCAELERVVTDDGCYRDFLSPDARGKLLREVEPGNATLSRDFGMTPFPTLTEQSTSDWKSYSGLSPERARELRERHNKIKRSAGYQLERANSVTAPGYPPVPRDIRFNRFRARLARIETRRSASLEALLVRLGSPASLLIAFVASPPVIRILFADPAIFGSQYHAISIELV